MKRLETEKCSIHTWTFRENNGFSKYVISSLLALIQIQCQ
jgi:hypothetical protein